MGAKADRVVSLLHNYISTKKGAFRNTLLRSQTTSKTRPSALVPPRAAHSQRRLLRRTRTTNVHLTSPTPTNFASMSVALASQRRAQIPRRQTDWNDKRRPRNPPSCRVGRLNAGRLIRTRNFTRNRRRKIGNGRCLRFLFCRRLGIKVRVGNCSEVCGF